MNMGDCVAKQIELIVSPHTNEWEKREAADLFIDMIRTCDVSITNERLKLVSDVIQQQLDDGGNYVKWAGLRMNFETALTVNGWISAAPDETITADLIDRTLIGERRKPLQEFLDNP